MARQGRRPGDVRLETQGRTVGRGMRSPTYNYRGINLAPMVLQWGPSIPVLAGDTLKACSIMGRIVGSPVTTVPASVTGSWFEHWLFYVRVGDLPTHAETMRDHISTGSPAAPTWTSLSNDLRAGIWTAYFKDEDEGAWGAQSNLRWPGQDWLDSGTPESALPPEDSITGSDWEDQWVRYQAMRRAKLTTNTFEEYLAKVGVAVPPQLRDEDDPERKRPELLHYTREFAYPQPTASPSGTDLAHAVQWFLQDRVQRARFFAEPGVLQHAFAVRPKAIMGPPSTLAAEAAPMNFITPFVMNMPPEFETDPHTSLVEVPASVWSPSGDTVPGTGNLVVDARDALLYGYDYWSGGAGVPTVRTPDRRPTAAQRDALPKYAADFFIRTSIASRIHKDTTF